MAAQDLPRCPGSRACVQDVVDPGVGAGPVEIPGQADARLGKESAPAFGARPRGFAEGQGSTGKPGETYFRMDLDDSHRRLPGPLLDLEQFRLEPERLNGDTVPGELAADG